MTDKQMQQKEKEIREAGFGWIDDKYNEPNAEYKKVQDEIGCTRMINAILAYNWGGETATEVFDKDISSKYSYLDKFVLLLGEEKVIDLIEEQINDIDHIETDVYTDSEGVSYNNIVWKDEVYTLTPDYTYKNDKKKNVEYWDRIEAETETYLKTMCMFGSDVEEGVRIEPDMLMIKEITEMVVKYLEDNKGAIFPYIDCNY